MERDAGHWDGDLRTMCTSTWVEDDSEIAAISIAENGYGRVWFNLRHLRIQNDRVVWHWGRAAALRQSFSVLYSWQIPSNWNDDRESVPA